MGFMEFYKAKGVRPSFKHSATSQISQSNTGSPEAKLSIIRSPTIIKSPVFRQSSFKVMPLSPALSPRKLETNQSPVNQFKGGHSVNMDQLLTLTDIRSTSNLETMRSLDSEQALRKNSGHTPIKLRQPRIDKEL